MSTAPELLCETNFGTGPAGSANSSVLVATPQQIVRVYGLYAGQVEALGALLTECRADVSDPRVDSWTQQENVRIEVVPLTEVRKADYVPANGAIIVYYGSPEKPTKLHLTEVQFNRERIWQMLQTHLGFNESEGPATTTEALFGSPLLTIVLFLGTTFWVFSQRPTSYWIAGGTAAFVVANVLYRLSSWPSKKTLQPPAAEAQ